jgi:hypothetical protein
VIRIPIDRLNKRSGGNGWWKTEVANVATVKERYEMARGEATIFRWKIEGWGMCGWRDTDVSS